MFFKDGLRRFCRFWQTEECARQVLSLLTWHSNVEQWAGKRLLLRLPVEEQYGWWLTLPPMPLEQATAAACWELESRLQEQGFALEDFVVKGFAKDTEAGNYWIVAVRRDVLAELRQEAERCCCDADFVAVSNDLSAEEVLTLYQTQAIGLLPQDTKVKWNYPRLSITLAVVVCTIMAGMALHAYFVYAQATQEWQQTEQEWQALQPQEERWQKLLAEQQLVQQQEEICARITQQSLACYPLLVHLGTLTQNGMLLEKLQWTAAGKLLLQGTVHDYDTLANGMQALDKDSFFPQNCQLAESSRKEDEAIAFQLSWPERADKA